MLLPAVLTNLQLINIQFLNFYCYKNVVVNTLLRVSSCLCVRVFLEYMLRSVIIEKKVISYIL